MQLYVDVDTFLSGQVGGQFSRIQEGLDKEQAYILTGGEARVCQVAED